MCNWILEICLFIYPNYQQIYKIWRKINSSRLDIIIWWVFLEIRMYMVLNWTFAFKIMTILIKSIVHYFFFVIFIEKNKQFFLYKWNWCHNSDMNKSIQCLLKNSTITYDCEFLNIKPSYDPCNATFIIYSDKHLLQQMKKK